MAQKPWAFSIQLHPTVVSYSSSHGKAMSSPEQPTPQLKCPRTPSRRKRRFSGFWMSAWKERCRTLHACELTFGPQSQSPPLPVTRHQGPTWRCPFCVGWYPAACPRSSCEEHSELGPESHDQHVGERVADNRRWQVDNVVSRCPWTLGKSFLTLLSSLRSRAMAEETVDEAIKVFNLTAPEKCQTDHIKLMGGHAWSKTMFIKLIQQVRLIRVQFKMSSRC
jgi:hypothetical protein